MEWLTEAEVLAIPDPLPLIPGFMNRNEKFILAGPEKRGKSFLALQGAWQLALGLPLFGIFPVPAPLRVMLIQFEIAPSSFKGRYLRYLNILGSSPNLRVSSNRDFRIDNDSHLSEMIRDVVALEPDLLIFDPLYYMHDQPENSDATKELCRRLDSLTPYTSVWVLHHMSKPITDAAGRVVSRGRSDIRGHSILIGWPDGIIEIRPGHLDENGLCLTYTLRNQPPIEGTELVTSGGLFVPAPTLTTFGVLRALREAGGTLPLSRLPGSRPVLDRILAELLQDGLIRDGRDAADRRNRVITLTTQGALLSAPSPSPSPTPSSFPLDSGTGEPSR